jgi:hypothetical protein
MVMLGGGAALDGFGGYFGWNPTSVDVDDYNEFGGSTINPDGNSGAGRWKRI